MNTTLLTRLSVLLCKGCQQSEYQVCSNCEAHKIVNELLVS